MKRQSTFLGVVLLAMIAAAAAFLGTQHSRQKLGQPGVRLADEPMYSADNAPSTNPPVLLNNKQVYLPPQVLHYRSQPGTVPTMTANTLPKDTVFGHRMYAESNGLAIDCQVVLMGADRSSIHKPEYCLKGGGFETISAEPATVRIVRPHTYDLPVMKLKLRRLIQDQNGAAHTQGGVFVYWFVADGELTARHKQRMWWMARDMLKTGVLQRWAYVICFAACEPGAEDATFERMQEFIAASVPQFHLTTGPPVAPAARAATN